MLRSSIPLSEIIIETDSGCELAPSNIDLAASELELVSEPGREHVLKEKVAPLSKRYEYILIDCQPSFGLLTLNALSAASHVLIPVQTEYFALRGMDLLFQTIDKVKARINTTLKVLGILPTLYDARTTHAREVLDELQRVYPGLVLKAVIHRTVKISDSTMAGEPILTFTPSSPATDAYRELASEVERRA